MKRGFDGVRIASGNVDGAFWLRISHLRRRTFRVNALYGYFDNQPIHDDRASKQYLNDVD
jgi:hypothetical protein